MTASPVLRVLIVIGLGLLLGNISFPGGFKLGVAAVLFAGLAMGAWWPGFTIPPVLQDLGLILFVYGVGLQAGPGFFRSFQKDGMKLNAAILVALGTAFLICFLLIHFAHQAADTVAGLFCGSLTNTPALGAATEAVRQGAYSGSQANSVVIGYGVAYPFAILIVLSIIQFLAWRERNRNHDVPTDSLQVRTLCIRNNAEELWTIRKIETQFLVRVTRVKSPHGHLSLSGSQEDLRPGTLITLVGTAGELEKASDFIGAPSSTHLQDHSSDLGAVDFYVSNPRICGQPLHQVEDMEGHLVISRIRRGDMEMAASPLLSLQPGDEVRVVVDRAHLKNLARFFGNSVTALSETCYLTFILGIVFGLLLGQIPIPIPGLASPLHLGLAGGPLLVGIFLGWLGRTGPLVWTMPYALNVGIRNFGILLFLAAVGTNAGPGLVSAFRAEGMILIAFAIVITLTTHFVAWLAMKLMGANDLSTLLGALSGLQTQPAALSFAAAKASMEKVQLGYASVYPLATLLKIIFAQLLLALH